MKTIALVVFLMTGCKFSGTESSPTKATGIVPIESPELSRITQCTGSSEQGQVRLEFFQINELKTRGLVRVLSPGPEPEIHYALVTYQVAEEALEIRSSEFQISFDLVDDDDGVYLTPVFIAGRSVAREIQCAI